MELITNVFENGNYLGALVATVASFALGFVWYHPKTFGTMWMKGVGMTEEKAKQGNMAAIFGTTAVVTFLAALAITAFVRDAGAVDGLKFGLFVGIFWGATTHVMHSVFEQRGASTIGLGVAHDIVHFGLVGLVAGAL